jgi:hypothetical protein
MPGTAPPKYHGRSFTGGGGQLLMSRTGPRDSVPCMYTTSFFYSTLTYQGDGREEALLKHLQSLPELSSNETSNIRKRLLFQFFKMTFKKTRKRSTMQYLGTFVVKRVALSV